MKKATIVLFSVLFILLSGCAVKESETPSRSTYPSATTYESETESTVVYVTKTGECYHRYNCSCLKYSKIEKNLSEVENKYRPCQICCPPEN